MKFVYLLILFCCIPLTTFGQYNDPNFPKPSSGYGADGPHSVGVITFENPYFASQDIKIYYPSDLSTQVPTLFYSHAYGGNFSSHIIGLLTFMAKKGYAIVFVPYQTTGVSIEYRYENLLEGFRKAARDYPDIIDTTRVGFMGHSFGGGACIGLAYQSFTQNNWGQNGRFIHASAPWYSFGISQEELQSFPADTKLLMEVYDDDVVNDHRMAVDIFNTIGISTEEKDFILVKADTLNGYIYNAGHDLPTTYSAFDAMDYYAYYRLLDALCDYTFNGSLAGKEVALGNGSIQQIGMPTGLKNLFQTDAPILTYPESKYTFPCSAVANPRNMYCGAITSLEESTPAKTGLEIYPNPASDQVTILLPVHSSGATLKLYNSRGQLVLSKNTFQQPSVKLDLASLARGVYFVTIGEWNAKLLME